MWNKVYAVTEFSRKILPTDIWVQNVLMSENFSDFLLAEMLLIWHKTQNQSINQFSDQSSV